MVVHLPLRPYEMFFFMGFLCVLLPPSDLQSIANERNPNTEPAHPSSSVKITPSKPQTSAQNTQLKNQSPPSSAKDAPQTGSQRTLGDAGTSSKQQPVKLLIVDTCIQKDTQGDTTNLTRGHSQEMNLEPGSPLVLTHKIHVVPGSCAGDCESEFSSLRKRLEKLEKEVSTLRNKCGGPDGTCLPPQQGGEQHKDQCPEDCSDQGRCERGKCVCFLGFSGPDCSTATCPSGCHNKGTCVDGRCVCDSGYTGPDCSVKSCPGGCGNHGRCVHGKCECDPGFSGDDCGTKSCPRNCSGKGQCMQGRCICYPGYTGPNCSRCKAGFSGAECGSGSSGRAITEVTIETVTMKRTPGNDTIKEKIHGKLDRTILSKNVEKKKPQRTSSRGKGFGENDHANKTKVRSDVNLGLGSTKSDRKLNVDMKLNNTKSRSKVKSDITSVTTKSDIKLDPYLKSNATKSPIKLDSDQKTNTTKSHTKLDSGLKSNATKSRTKMDSDLKSGTEKSHTKENEGATPKTGHISVTVKKPVITAMVHTNASRTGQTGHRVVKAKQPNKNRHEKMTKARKPDLEVQTKDDKSPKPGIKRTIDTKQDSTNRTHIKSDKSVHHNVPRAFDFVNQTKVPLKGKGSFVKAINRIEPGNGTEKMVLSVKNGSKIVEKKFFDKTTLSHGKVNRTQTDGKHPETSRATVKHNKGSSVRKDEVIPANGTDKSTLRNGTAMNNAKTGSTKDGTSSVNQTNVDKTIISQGKNTTVSKRLVDETQKSESSVNGTGTWENTAPSEPLQASKNIHPHQVHTRQFRNGTHPTSRVSHHPSRGPQRGSSFPKMKSQPTHPSGEDKGIGPTGSHVLADRNNTNRGGQRTQEMQNIPSIQQDVPNMMTLNDEVIRYHSSNIKIRQDSPKISHNSTSNHSSKVESHSVPSMEAKSNSSQKEELPIVSLRVQNITSRGFIIIWETPQGMFNNFTVTRREYRMEIAEEDEVEEIRDKEEDDEGEDKSEDDALGQKNSNRKDIDESAVGFGVVHRKSSNNSSTVHAPPEAHNDTSTKAQARRFTQVVPGSTHSLSFHNLRPQSQYLLSLYGTSAGLRSKIHRLTVTTAPEPPTDLLFSNVTDSSLSLSWTKPRNPVDGFKVAYTKTENGTPVSVTANAQHSSMVLSQLFPGSSYEVSVFSMKGQNESDPLTGLVVTVPDPPTSLQVINITYSEAILQWTPATAKVDRYIVVYGSENVPEVTIKISGGRTKSNVALLRLMDLERATVYNVTVTSQLDSLQSTAAKASFTTTRESGLRWEQQKGLIASHVTPHSAVLSWRAASTKLTGYKLSSQLAGQEMKEMILDSTVTQQKLTGLLPMSKYTIRLQAKRGDHYGAPMSIEFSTGPLRFPFPTDCSQELLNGRQHSGETLIYPNGRREQAVQVYCDMETDGGGWMVFQRRMNGRTNFFRSWNDYSKGFGNLSEEFWLGNELIHNLTSLEPMVLWVDLKAGVESAFARYSTFSIDSQRKFYTVRLSGYSGTAGDSMQYHNGQPFSTKDRDPKPVIGGCAMSYRGGWWYKDCHEANLNGLYDINTNHQGVIWTAWKGRNVSIPFTEMKIRPQSFNPNTQE